MISKILQIWFGDITKEVEAAAEVNSAEFGERYTLLCGKPAAEAEEEALDLVADPDWWRIFAARRPHYRSDFVRFFIASRSPGLLYLDIDCTISDIPILPQDGRPHFGQIYPGKIGIGNHIFAVNAAVRWFRQLLSDCPGNGAPDRFVMPIWLMKRDDVGIIPTKHFHHGRWTKNAANQMR